MTKRQMTLKEQLSRLEEVEAIARGYIMAEIDPPFCEVRHINNEIGNGVFATQDLSQGDFVLEYQGELISMKEAKVRDEKYEKDKEGSFIVYFQDKKGTRLCVDATHSKTMGRIVNDGWKKHEKNCFLRIVQCENKSYICLFASRDIRMGEEIRFDYGVPNLPWRKKRKGKQGAECGICAGCVRIDDCKECRTCKNMKKFGGPGTMKQKCMLKQCNKMMAASPGQGLTPKDKVTSSQNLPSTENRKEEKSVRPPSEPVTKSKRTNQECDDFVPQQRKTGSHDNKKKKNRPVSLSRVKLRRPKTSKKCLKYYTVPSREIRGRSRDHRTISPNDSGTSNLRSINTRSKVYDFDSFDEIQPLETGSQEVKKQTHSEDHTSAPEQNNHKEKERSAQGQNSSKGTKHTSAPGRNSRKDKEHTSAPGQNSSKGTKHTSAPGQNSRKDKEHMSAPGQNSSKVTKHTSAPGRNSRKYKEHTSAPGQNNSKDKECTSAPGHICSKDIECMPAQGENSSNGKEHTSIPVQNSCNDKECTSAPGQNSNKDKECTSAPGHISSKDKECTSAPEHISSKDKECTSAPEHISSKDKECTSAPEHISSKDKECTSAPGQNRNKDKECRSAPELISSKDKDTAWFEGTELVDESGQNTEEESQNVSSQNDMTYLTQRKYSSTTRRAKLDGIIAKLRTKSDSFIAELSSDDVFLKDKLVSKKRRCRSDMFEKDLASEELLFKRKNTKVEENQPIIEMENVARRRLSKRKNSEVQQNQPVMEKENVTCAGRLSKRKRSEVQETEKQSKQKGSSGVTNPAEADDASVIETVTRNSPLDFSVISHVPAEKCMFPFFEDRSQDAFEETTIIEPDAESPKGADTNSSDAAQCRLVQTYQQCLSDMVEFLEKRVACQGEVGPSSRRKLVKRLTRKKARIEDLLNEVSEKKDTSGPSMFPRRRKLEGEGASRMLQRLYKTLMIQTAECVQERLDETSFELQVTFKQDEELKQGQKQMDVPNEELELGEPTDDKPETWKDISVIVKYTADTQISKEKEDLKVKEQMSCMVHFLDYRISQLQENASNVHKILRKTIKKIKKRMLVLS